MVLYLVPPLRAVPSRATRTQVPDEYHTDPPCSSARVRFVSLVRPDRRLGRLPGLAVLLLSCAALLTGSVAADAQSIRTPAPAAPRINDDAAKIGPSAVSTAFDSEQSGICARTKQVREAILSRIDNIADCADVTNSHLAGITGELDLESSDITSLRPGDFAGLSSVQLLSLYDNALTTLPSGLLNGLSNLQVLYLEKNALTALPSDLLEPVRELAELWARNNVLTELPAGFFSGVQSPGFDELHLYNNPGDPDLRHLSVCWDKTYCAGGAPIPIEFSVQALGEGRFKVAVPVGTPFDVKVALDVTNGTIAGDTITIPVGRVESDIMTITRAVGTDAAVTVDIVDLRATDVDPRRLRTRGGQEHVLPLYHAGVALVKADPPTTAAPEVTGPTSFTVTEGETAVGTLTASDEDTAAEDLAWSLVGGPDEGEFALTAVGALSFGAAKDYESPDDSGTDGTYEVTVEVNDGANRATAEVTVTLANRNEAPRADAGSDQTDIAGGTTVTLRGSASDPDADETLTYAWSQTAGTNVTLTSASSATTTFTAPSGLTANETLTFQLRVTDAGGLSAEDETNVTVLADKVETALTASFVDMPASHAGAEFTFGLTFSEEIDNLSYKTLRDYAFEVTGGAVRNAQRKEQGKNQRWTITVAPDGQGDVTITLPETTDCAASGAICTGDGRPLSHTLLATVTGPAILPAVSVSNASASEGEAVEFGVSLSTSSSGQVTVEYATSGGTATSGTDFTAASGTLTFEANETAKTVSVATTEDSDDEANETFTLTLTRPEGATLGDAAATGTIVDDDEAVAPLTGFTLVDAGTDTDIGMLTDGASFTFDDPANGNYGIRAETAADAEIGSVKFSLSGAKTVLRTENIPPYSLYGDDGANVAGEGLPAGSYALTATAYVERGGTGDMLGKLSVSFTVVAALTASFSDMPASHAGATFTFGLTFSEEFGLSYKTLRDHAFEVTGGEVRNAQRQQQGSNLSWTISVQPASATDTVKIRLPAPTDCNAAGAICTADGRRLSHSLSATVVPASASASQAPSRDAVTLGDALALLEGLTPDEAAAALFGERGLSEARLAALDRLGNGNGRYDLGDMLSWRDRCRRGEARCGGASTGSGPASSALLPSGMFAAPATARRRRRDSGHPRPRVTGTVLALLFAAVTAWSCADGPMGPATPTAAVPDPGFLNVGWTPPGTARDIGVLLELEGPGIEAVRTPGYEVYRSGAPGPHQIVVAGALAAGPLVQFRVPDRSRPSLYRVRVLQVTGEDYGLRHAGEYRAAVVSK